MRTINRDIVSALIISKDNRLLMGMKDPTGGGVYSDCWHIPGGGIDDGENKIDALKREVFEEIGLDISGCQISLVDDFGSGETEKTLKDTGEKVVCKMEFNVYRVDLDKDSHDVAVIPGDDLVKLDWAGLGELDNYKLTPPSKSLFDRLGLITGLNK